jgi:hypothetical protein
LNDGRIACFTDSGENVLHIIAERPRA